MTKNIMFVCKNNRFRSQIAKAYFKKINKNKKIKISSAGIFQGYPISKKTARIVKKLGIKMKGKPRAMSTPLLEKQDLIVITADDVPKSIFKNKPVKKLIRFRINDTSSENDKKIIKITEKIIKKLDKLKEDIESGRLKI